MEMAKSGNNEDFTFVTIGKEDFDDVIHLLSQYFIPFEPICMGIDCSFQHKLEFFESYVGHYLNTGVSIGTRTNEGKFIGVNLAGFERRAEKVEMTDFETKFARYIYEVLSHMTDNYDMFQKHGVNKVVYHAIGCVRPEYQCRGINRKMKENTEQKAKEKGSRVAYSISSGIKSQASLRKIGYVTGYEAQYKNFDFLKLTAMGEHKSCKLMVKTLIS